MATSPEITVETLNALHAQAQQHLSQRQLGETQLACMKILRLDKQHPDAHFLLGMVSASLQKFSNAIEFIERAWELDPKRAEYGAQLGRCLAVLKRDAEALAAVEKALALRPLDPLTLDTIGVVLSRAGQHARAVDVYREVVRLAPDNAGHQFNLAASLKFLGDFDGAETAYEAAIAANPRYYKAHSALAQLRRHTPENNHIARLEKLLAEKDIDIDGELHLRHALAKELEDLGQYEPSFRHLAFGKQRKQAKLDYDIRDDAKIFAALARAFPSDQKIVPALTARVDEPIFVVGMPRTGTTLVERILSSHQNVHSAGELQTFGLLLKQEAGTKSTRVLDAETVEAAQYSNMAAVGKKYLKEGYRVAGLASRFVDKMPLNFLYLGYIHQALPNARFICLQRNPMDTILSNFRQLFSVRFSYYNYAYDLKNTARYYLMFQEIMERWQALLPDNLLQVSYEQLVENQEAESRRILDHCNLPWDDACLAFEKNTAPVATASAVQVREPMYRKAVSRWKLYEQELEPARVTLEAAGISID